MIRRFFRAVWNGLTTAWVLALMLTLLLVLLVWLAGPYVAIADNVLLESVNARLIASLILVFCWGLFVAVFYSRRKKKELADPEKAAEAEQRGLKATATREERDYIKDKLKSAIRIVTQSNFYGSSSRSRYTLPWFMVIGTENCGKTSLLLNSGIQFPLNEQADRHLYQLRATTRCETLFANQAVFIDTPGNYTTNRKDTEHNELWQYFLRRLFRVRPANPLNGVIVCVSIRDIMDADATRREHVARNLRERLSEVLKALRTHVPVFLMFTKCDVIPGFAEFFAQLPRAEREQIFGCPTSDGLHMEVSHVRAEMADMLQRLNAQIISKIHQERDTSARGDMFRFPQELALLGPCIEDFIAEAFGPSRYHRPVMFRGFFFSSALSSQDVLKSVARGGELAFQTGFQPSLGDYAKGFFILRFLQDCVIPEASLAGTDKEQRWGARLRRHGLQLASAALFLFVTSFLATSFLNNYTNINAISGIHDAFGVEKQKAPVPPDAKTVLPGLDIVEKTALVYDPENDSEIAYGLGLYQGNTFQQATHAAYLGQINERLLPHMRQIAKAKIEQSLTNISELKAALRAYLMLCEPKRINEGFITDWLERQWSSLYMGDAQTQASLAHHMEYAFNHGITPVAPDPVLLEKARQALLKIPLAELAYQQMKDEAADNGKPPFTFRARLGETMSPFDGDTHPIPFLYTRAGYTEYCLERCPAIIRGLTEESWIFGSSPISLSALDMDKIYNDVRGMYFRDYTRYWREAIQKLSVPAPNVLSVAAKQADQLTSGVSPVTLVLREVRDNTNLILEENAEEASPVADAAAAQLQRQAGRKLGAVAGRQLGQAMTQSAADNLAAAQAKAKAAAQKDALAVRQYFVPLVSLIDADGNPAPALKAAHEAMANVGSYFSRLENSDDPAQRVFTALLEIADGKDDTLRTLEAAASKLPSPVRGWYESVAGGGLRRMLVLAGGTINQVYREKVFNVYHRELGSFYPFDNRSETDVNLDNFASFFRSGGTLDSFYDAYLEPFVDRNGAPRSIMGRSLPLSPDALVQLGRANRVQSAFFSAGRDLGITFTVEPYALDAKLKQVELVSGDKTVRYWHGPVQGATYSWPEKTGSGKAWLDMTDLGGVSNRSNTRGEWALFRLFQSGTLKKQEGNTCLIELQQNGKWAQFLIQLRSKLNPLDPRVCSFNLPESLQ